MIYLSAFSVILLIRTLSAIGPTEPQQIHLSYGEVPETMVVTWTTTISTTPTFAQYSINNKWMMAKAMETKFVDLGPNKRTQYVYRAWMKGLIPGHRYVYRVGSAEHGVSDLYNFTTISNGSKTFLIIGDLGWEDDMCFPGLSKDAMTGQYDALIHVGDIAYDLHTNESRRGDQYMNRMQPIVANMPYMTCPGNHEFVGNFSNYKHRFTMPTDEFGMRLFYSVDIGPVHLISINTEYYFFVEFGFWQILNQHQWLERDLERANRPEARAKHPWIITIGHRSLYCTNDDYDQCRYHFDTIRRGIPGLHILGVEKLLYKYGVDLSLWAHEHSYERLWPLYDYQVMNGSYSRPYTNPRATVHITSGAAGNVEKVDRFNKTLHTAWSAFRSTDFSYIRMKVFNYTHLYTELVSHNQGGNVIDKIMLIKDKHGPF